jgi:hypothetical protein
MKMLGRMSVLALAMLAPSGFAATTFVEQRQSGFQSTATVPVTFTTAVAVSDLLFAQEWVHTGSAISPAVTDNINSGSWNIIRNQADPSNSFTLVTAWIKCDHAGTITVTGGPFTAGGFFTVLHYNGFAAGAALMTADSTINSGTGTTYTATGFTNSQANEMIILSEGDISNGNPGTPAAFTVRAGATDYTNAELFKATSGNSITASSTVAASVGWIASLAGFYDTSGSSCTHSFWRIDGTFAVPNGTTGSYWNVGTGSFTTPNCSTGSYALSTGGSGSN